MQWNAFLNGGNFEHYRTLESLVSLSKLQKSFLLKARLIAKHNIFWKWKSACGLDS